LTPLDADVADILQEEAALESAKRSGDEPPAIDTPDAEPDVRTSIQETIARERSANLHVSSEQDASGRQ